MKISRFVASLVLCGCIGIGPVFASGDVSSVPDSKRTKLGLYLSPQAAYERVQKSKEKVLFLDVRTRAEINFLGMPYLVDANVPYMKMDPWMGWDPKKEEFKQEVNQDFASRVATLLGKKHLNKDSEIVLICRSGKRSAKAADLLADLGYTHVYSVVPGYEGDKAKEGPHKGHRFVDGWRNAGLPWGYKLDHAKMYFD